MPNNSVVDKLLAKALLTNGIKGENRQKALDLIEKGGNVNHPTSYGETFLMRACYKGDIELVKFLLEQGGYVNAIDDERENCLAYACRADTLTDVEMEELVSLLVSRGVEINTHDVTSSTTLLMELSWRDRPLSVLTLIKAGAKIEARDLLGNTALIRAATKGNPECVSVLLQAGADLRAENDRNESSLYFTHKWNQKPTLEVIERFIKTEELEASLDRQSSLEEAFRGR